MTLRTELAVAHSELTMRGEELKILRAAQQECSQMAAEIVALQACVEEQRLELLAKSTQPKDPGVGIYVWMQSVSAAHQERLTKVYADHQAAEQSMQETHAHQLAFYQTQIMQLNSQLQTVTEQLATSQAVVAEREAELTTAYHCIEEQRRHMEVAATKNPNVGLVPLIKKGYLVDPAWMRSEVDRQVEEECAAMRASVSSLVVLQQQCNDELQRELTEVKAALQTKCMEYDVKCELLTTASLELELRGELEVQHSNREAELVELVEKTTQLEADKQKLLKEVEFLTKEKDACIKGIKHWQAETANITQNLVGALSSRDALQLKLYTVSAELQEKERAMGVMEELLKKREEADKFALQVCGLARVYAASRPVCDPAIDALEDVDVPQGEQVKEKSKQKKRKSKTKA